MSAAGAVVPRATVETIVRLRNRTLELYADAHQSIEAASQAIARATGAIREINPRRTALNHHVDRDMAQYLLSLNAPGRAVYLTTARRITDTNVWSHIVEITDLERLMDREAKEQLRQQLLADPPEVTVDNVYATLERFAQDAGLIFRRGIANAFSRLDRRFRSHDGFKIGARVILDRAFNEWGSWNYYNDQRAAIIDIERVFAVFDGAKDADFTSIIHKIDQDRGREMCRRRSETEGTYFKVRTYKNGNAHLWFTRDDLVEKVNKLLAEYYGEVIPDGRQAEDDPLKAPKTTPAKHYGFYPTPADALDHLFARVPLYRKPDAPKFRCLEPSAGTGNIARRIAADGEIVDCVEVQQHLAADLRASGLYRAVYAADFFALRPETTGLYDRIVMNPPFDRERDIDHVMHALSFLEPGGFLAAIMSAGTEFRETRKSTAFRALMEKMNARWTDLPAGSFAESGTYCNTLILTVWKDGREHR